MKELIEDVTLMYEKEVNCPCCENRFITNKVRFSRLRLDRRDEDLFNYYKGINPIKYSIFLCPKCGYAASESKFDKITRGGITDIRNIITSRWVTRDFGGKRTVSDAIEVYKIALLQGTILKYNNVELGNISLSIGWLYRTIHDDAELRFLEIARDKYIEAYHNDSLVGTNMDETKLTYLIGELSRRLEDFETSNKWFGISIQSPGMKTNPTLNNLARDQWRIVKDILK